MSNFARILPFAQLLPIYPLNFAQTITFAFVGGGGGALWVGTVPPTHPCVMHLYGHTKDIILISDSHVK